MFLNAKPLKKGCGWKEKYQAMYRAKMLKLDHKISKTEAYSGKAYKCFLEFKSELFKNMKIIRRLSVLT